MAKTYISVIAVSTLVLSLLLLALYPLDAGAQGAPTTECNDGIDQDGNGRTDYPSDVACDGPDDETEQYCRDVGVSAGGCISPYFVSIQYTNGRFRGTVYTANRPRCNIDRRVVVKQRRAGRDAIVGRDRTGTRAAWSVPSRDARGKYYAVALPKIYVDDAGYVVPCEKIRSVTIRV